MFEKLTVKWPNDQEVEYELHSARAKILYNQGIIERDGPGKHILHRGLGEGQAELVLSLLDLEGDML